MTRLDFLTNLNDIRDEQLLRMDALLCGKASAAARLRKRRIVALALAAALILALGITAYAVGDAVTGPDAAERVALRQLEVWKELGLISQDVTFEGPADEIVEREEWLGGDSWYGRLFRHRYDVRWYYDRDGGKKYGCSLGVDTLSGKIFMASLFALADENDAPAGRTPVFASDEAWVLYDNFDDIVPTDLTLDGFCSLLAEYWGFSGYRLGTYRYRQIPPDGSARMIDLPKGNIVTDYLTVFFEGDQEGAPMYLEMNRFADHVAVSIGTGHAVG